MILNSIEAGQPEPKPNSEPKAQDKQVSPSIANAMLGDVYCQIEVPAKEGIFKECRCKYKAKYKVYWRFKNSSSEVPMISVCCERHKKLWERDADVMMVQNIA